MSETVVSVLPVTAALAPAVRALRANADQYAFVGDVVANLLHAEASPASEPMAVLADGAVVGFYRIDLRPGAIAGCDYGNGCAALRAFVIDRSRQGQGLGTLALRACCADLEARHPALRMLALAVDCANAGAISAYRNAGFVDGGALQFGAGIGPHRLMLRRLGPAGVQESAA
jgi:RimJ/RimL family protein N-acetyltransferase